MQEHLKIFLVIFVTLLVTLLFNMIFMTMLINLKRKKNKKMFIQDMKMVKLPIISNITKLPVAMSDDMIQKLYTENMDLIQNVYLNNDSRKLFQDTIKLNQNSKYKMSCFESQMLLKFLPMLLVALAQVITTVTADVVLAILVALSAVISLKISKISKGKDTPATVFTNRLRALLVAGDKRSMIQPVVTDSDVDKLVTASGLNNQAPPTIDWTKLMTATKNLLVPPPGSNAIPKTYNLPIMNDILSVVVPMLSYEISLITPLNDPFCASVKNSTASISHKNNTNSLISSLINLYSTTLLARLGPPTPRMPRPMPGPS